MENPFFKEKRPWSKYKDLILEYYLEPYLSKVKKLGRPIVLIDAFAGPGQFDDGEKGSPIILCEAVQNAHIKNVDVSVICIEKDQQLFAALQTQLKEFKFATPRPSSFSEFCQEVVEIAKSSSVFLYLDPFNPRPLLFDELAPVFRQIRESNSSVEVLMNFSASRFLRWCLAAIQRDEARFADEEEDILEANFVSPEIQELNAIAGGDYWQQISYTDSSFPEKSDALVNAYKQRLGVHFREVCAYPIKKNISDTVPNYYLVFGSRHPDALLLMNNATAKARKLFVDASLPQTGMLFDVRPDALAPDEAAVERAVMAELTDAMSRKTLIHDVIRAKENFSLFTESDMKRAVQRLMKSGKVKVLSGKKRINDDDIVSVA